MLVDFTGTAAEVDRGGVNAPLVYTRAHTIYALMCLLTSHLPNNEGCFRPITIIAPEGCVLNCRYPASVNERTLSGWHILPAIYAALADVLPQNVMAGCGLLQSFQTRGLNDGYGRPFNVPCFSGGGQGASFARDGLPGYIFPSTSSGMSIEVFESKSPGFIRSKSLLPDSGGAGQYRGGLGQRMVISKLPGYEMPLYVYAQPDLRVIPPQGLLGGKTGYTAHLTLNGEVPATGSQFDREGYLILYGEEDVIVFDLPGGGGYGDPRLRDRDALRSDLARGYVSLEGLRRDYSIDMVDLESDAS
jgi:N-methylhydantoinase B/oxoprolinase/acetone carboxylase alpha subunit